jgi:hypothetical protein
MRRALYALLTGRVASVTGQAALDDNNKYIFLGKRRQEGALNNYATYVQDSWRVSPTGHTERRTAVGRADTIQRGQRQFFSGDNGRPVWRLRSWRRQHLQRLQVLHAGRVGRQESRVLPAQVRHKRLQHDWNNFAPNVGVAWRPNVQSGFMRKFLGDPEQATLRGGYSVQYERQGFGAFTGIYGGNPGATISLTRNASTGLVNPGETWPILLSQRDRLYPAPFPESPTYPIQLRANRADSLNGFHPDIEIASARTWTVGLQRSITERHGDGSAVRGHARREPVVHAQLQRAEPDRKRVLR